MNVCYFLTLLFSLALVSADEGETTSVCDTCGQDQEAINSPWVVLVEVYDSNGVTKRCSGIFLSRTHILVAADCVSSAEDKNIMVYLWMHLNLSKWFLPAIGLKIERVIRHQTEKVALIELADRIHSTSIYNTPICLSNSAISDYDNQKVVRYTVGSATSFDTTVHKCSDGSSSSLCGDIANNSSFYEGSPLVVFDDDDDDYDDDDVKSAIFAGVVISEEDSSSGGKSLKFIDGFSLVNWIYSHVKNACFFDD